MAATDPQRQLLTLIRDFASEKSQGERRVVGLEKRIVELGCQLDAANAEMEEVKRFKETTELELKGYEFQLAFNDVSIQTLEARISMIQDEISSVGSEVEGLKDEEGASRDEFIRQMFELNTKIRNFQAEKRLESQKKSSIATTADCKAEKKAVTDVDLRALKDVLAHVASQIIKEEQEYLAEENIQKQVREEYVDLQRKVSLVDVIVKETEVLQDLTRNISSKIYDEYAQNLTSLTVNKQTSELEQDCASLGEQLQNRCICPICRADNVEALGGVLEANKAN